MSTAIGAETGITTEVVWAVADHKGVDPMDLPPLYNVVNTNALNMLFSGVQGDGNGCEVRFTYDGVDVSVTHDEIQTRDAV